LRHGEPADLPGAGAVTLNPAWNQGAETFSLEFFAFFPHLDGIQLYWVIRNV
jgi:hypothetical protein